MHLVDGKRVPNKAQGRFSRRKIRPGRCSVASDFVKIDYVFIVNDTAAQAVLDASSPLQRTDRLLRCHPPTRATNKEDTS